MILILILLLSLFNVTMFHTLGQNTGFYQLNAYTWETDDFRAMRLGPEVAALHELDFDQLAALMVDQSYDLTEVTDLSCSDRLLRLNKPADYRKLSRAYETVLSDLVYFPIPESTNGDTPDVTYEDGWQQLRTYGGERGHEGCDIMGEERERGFYPVVSISSGTVEKVGWLEKGGWRIGIRSESGAYLYYAHLYSYSREWKEGDPVAAGELLGFMGDSGYGKKEGTVGNFPVHLHLGIYIETDHQEEMSVNPYWILRYLEKRRLKYDY